MVTARRVGWRSSSVTVALVSEGLVEVLVRGGLERDRPGSTEAEKMRATEVTVIRG